MDTKKSFHGKNSKEKVCFNCLTRETPLWRRSKKGANLCNACGLYYRNHGEHRPVPKPSNYQNHLIPSQREAEVSAMEKMAVDVLLEMRSKARGLRLAHCHRPDYANGEGTIRRSSLRRPPKDLMYPSVLNPGILKEKPCIRKRSSGGNTLCRSEDRNDQLYNCRGEERCPAKSHQFDGRLINRITGEKEHWSGPNVGCNLVTPQGLRSNDHSALNKIYESHYKRRLAPMTFFSENGTFDSKHGASGCYGVDDRDSEELREVVNRLASLSDQ